MTFLTHRHRLCLAFLAIGALPLLLGVVFSAYKTARDRSLAADDALAESTSAAHRLLSDDLTRNRQIVLLLAERLRLQDPPLPEDEVTANGNASAKKGTQRDELSATLERLVQTVPNVVAEACVIDGTGPETARSIMEMPRPCTGSSTEVSTASSFQSTLAAGPGKVVIRSDNNSTDGSTRFFSLSEAIRTESGVTYVLNVKIPLAAYDARLRLLVPQDGQLLVLDDRGEVLTAVPPTSEQARGVNAEWLRGLAPNHTDAVSTRYETVSSPTGSQRILVHQAEVAPDVDVTYILARPGEATVAMVLGELAPGTIAILLFIGLIAFSASSLLVSSDRSLEGQATPRATRSGMSLRGWMFIAIALAGAITVSVGVASFHESGLSHRRSMVALARLQVLSHTIFETVETMGQTNVVSDATIRSLANQQHERDAELQRLGQGSPATARRISEGFGQFDTGTNELMRLIQSGRYAEAYTLFRQSLAPRATDLSSAIVQATNVELGAAEQAETVAGITTTAAILLAVLLTGLIFWRFEQARATASILQGAEHSLRESERRLSSLVRNATDVIFIIRPDGVIKYKSPAAGLVWGWRPETLIGWDYLRIIHPEDHSRAQELLSQTSQRPQMNVGGELRFQSGAGSWRDAEVVAINLLNDSAVEGIVLTCRDITYRKRAEDKIRSMNAELEQRVVERTAQLQVAVTDLEAEVRERRRVEEERSRLLQEVDRDRGTLLSITASMTDGLLVLAPSGEVRFCNQQAAKLLGMTAEEVTGQDVHYVWWAKRNSFEEAARAWALLDLALAGDENAQRFELTIISPITRDIVFDFFPLKQVTGGDARTGIILRDVTAERSLDRTKDELVSVVSHELRTPLTSLVGFAELLLKRDLSNEQRNKFVGVMLDEGKRLTVLLNDFLDLQRIESGRHQLNQKPMHLYTLLERASTTTTGSDHPITLHLPDSLPPVHVDPDRLQQVLSNLLSNAKKYSPNGGEIEISAEPVKEMVEVAIKDHGLGIPGEALPHLFQKFYRIDNSDRRSIKGTGLGLAICRRIIEEHGGQIWAESEGLGHGSTIHFTLPIMSEADSSPALPSRGSHQGELVKA